MSLTRRPPWQLATLIGVGGIAIVTVVFGLVFDDVPSEVPALLLLVAIATASVVSNWRVGLPMAVLGALIYGLVFLPPFGVIRVGAAEDVAIMVTFVLVAVLVSVLVSRRSIANRAELIGSERLLLLRSVAHDVRNPLHAILAASSELYDGADYDPETRRRLLGLVIEETRRLDRIVDNLLSLSRLQAGALAPAREHVAVADIAERCRSRFDLIGGEGDTLEIADDLPDIELDVDPVQIDQVLTNLVENCVRHASDPVHVTISVARQGSMLEWWVMDDGPGFSPSAREMLFTPFRSAHGSSGLGLTLCKAVVEAHAGTITVDDAPGAGASIRFTVPVAS